MSIAIERLQSLRVADVMSRVVIPVAESQSLIDVAKTFRSQQISSAPVVDAQGLCIGVLSATDFLKHVADLESDRTDAMARDYMTTAVQSIAPEAPILLAARIMCVEHLHRLFVLDSCSRPIGVISSMDIVAALSNAMDEMIQTRAT